MTADRDQFLAMRVAQATQTYDSMNLESRRQVQLDAYISSTLQFARADWEKKQAKEHARAKQTTSIEDLNEELATDDTTTQIVIALDLARAAVKAIPTDTGRRILTLRLEGLDYRTIARYLDLSEATISHHLKSIRGLLTAKKIAP